MSSTISFREGIFKKDCHRMMELFEKNWEETLKNTFNADLNQNLEYYKDLENEGNLFSVIAEDENGDIVGYVVGQVHGHPYMKTKRMASVSMFYMDKSHRKTLAAKSLLEEAEKQCEDKQVDYLNIGIGNNEKLKPYLKLLGFELADVIMTKRIS